MWASFRSAPTGKGLLQLDATALGAADHLVARDLQQATVHRMCDGLLLCGGVHRHSLQRLGLDGGHCHGSVEGGFEQLLQPLFADVAPESPDLCGATGQAVLVVLTAAEELPQRVLSPALAHLLVAEAPASE